MDRSRFLTSFARLLERWLVYQDAPREPDRVVELASARCALDDARRTVAEAREGWESRPQAPTRPATRTSVSDDDLARLRVQVYPS
ncbi:MAG: hypothetical protein ACN4GK_10115 [Acidimicrobiia bacterium]